MKNNRGQNVIEYILLVAAVLTVFVLFLNQGGTFHRAVEKSLFNATVDQTRSLGNNIVLP